MTDRVHILTVLKCIQDLEEASAALYAFYADVFEHHELAATIFRQMKREEEGHRNQAALQSRIVQKNPEKFGDVEVCLEEIKALTSEIDTQIGGGVFDLSDAVSFAIHLEEHSAELHFRTFAARLSPELTALAAFLRGGDEAHVQKLKDLAQKLDVDG